MTVNELRNFVFENYYKRIGFARENSFYSIIHQKRNDSQLFPTKLTKKFLRS